MSSTDLNGMTVAKVVFTALPYATGTSGSDSSDYFLREFSAEPAYNDVFTYTVVDKDGSTDEAELTIKIKDDGPTVVEGECLMVFEDDLPEGTSPNPPALTVSGALGVPDLGFDGLGGFDFKIADLEAQNVTSMGMAAGLYRDRQSRWHDYPGRDPGR